MYIPPASIASTGKDRGKGGFHLLLMNVLWDNLYGKWYGYFSENCFYVPQKFIYLALTRAPPKTIWGNIFISVFIAAQAIIAKIWKQPNIKK